MMNVFMTVHSNREGYCTRQTAAAEVIVIPRRAHRPACYGTDEDRMLISPGAIDVGGTIITSRQKDFDGLDGKTLETILRETTYFTD